MAFAPPPVSFDEAQYWFWSQSLEFGYYSKPPLVAWVIALAASLCGEGAGCLKSGATLAHAGTAIVLVFLGRALFDAEVGARVGAWAGALWASLPAVSLSSMMISTDPFLLFFWALSMLCLVKAADGGKRTAGWWLGLGLSFGFGLLAKYAMALFLLSVLLWLLLCPERRVVLRARGAWLALAAGLAVYLPNLLWNAANGFVSYAHTRDNANLGGRLGHPDKLAEFILGQFAVFGPLAMAALVVALVLVLRRRNDERLTFLAAFIVPVLAVMIVQSFLSRANANWTGPAYVGGVLLVAAWLPPGWNWLLRASLALNLLTVGILYNFEAIRRGLDLPNIARLDPLKNVRGWDAIGSRVSAHLAALPGARLLADERKVLASLLYYVHPHPFDAVKWNPAGTIHDHFDLTTRLHPGPGTFVWATRMDEMAIARVAASFETATRIEDVRIGLHDDFERRLVLMRLDGFKGYPQ